MWITITIIILGGCFIMWCILKVGGESDIPLLTKEEAEEYNRVIYEDYEKQFYEN